MTDRLRPGMLVTVHVYGRDVPGAVTADQPLARQQEQGRTLAVRLNTGSLRFFTPDEVQPR